jgi:heme/copper-type cytochrome/quinol oxidase subunit 3
MNAQHDRDRVLRWYPTRWRSRYEEEFLAYLDDRYGQSRLPRSALFSIAFSGLRERGRESGLIGDRVPASTQRKTGSLVVLVAWSIMIIGGAVLQKSSEHFNSSLPTHSQFAARIAFDTTAVAGIFGCLFVLAGAAAAIPAFTRHLRAEKWSSVRRRITAPVIATLILIAAVGGLSVWAHQLTSAQRNGSNVWYSSAFLACVFLVVMTIALWTRVLVDIAIRCDFTARELRRESFLALGVCLSSLCVLAGTITWWIQMAQHGSWFFSGTVYGPSSSPWPPNLIVAGSVMLIGTVIALCGATRILRSYLPAR